MLTRHNRAEPTDVTYGKSTVYTGLLMVVSDFAQWEFIAMVSNVTKFLANFMSFPNGAPTKYCPHVPQVPEKWQNLPGNLSYQESNLVSHKNLFPAFIFKNKSLDWVFYDQYLLGFWAIRMNKARFELLMQTIIVQIKPNQVEPLQIIFFFCLWCQHSWNYDTYQSPLPVLVLGTACIELRACWSDCITAYLKSDQNGLSPWIGQF